MHNETTFTEIFKRNLWGNGESVSGPGSTFQYTANLRKELPALIKAFSIKSIFDAPCGDLNWMKHLLDDLDADYIGGDIVPPLIQSHRENYTRKNTSFIQIDLTREKFPQTDLMICRDCLFHLSFQDTLRVLQNFVDSNTKYLLTTTHKKSNRVRNADIQTGGVRLIDLFSAPYDFPSDPLYRFEDWVPPYQEREMCLWSRDQVIIARDALACWVKGQAEKQARSPDSRAVTVNADKHAPGRLGHLALSLADEGRPKDALLLLEHLADTGLADMAALRTLVKLLNAENRTLEALAVLARMRNSTDDPANILPDIQENLVPAIECFNRHLTAGKIEDAERIAASLAVLVPGNPAILNAALSCNLALNRLGEVQKYQAALKALDAGNAALPASNSRDDDVERCVSEALSESKDHPLLKLRNMHDAMSAILIRPLGERSGAQIEKLLATARALEIPVPPDSEWADWKNHYRAMVDAADIGSVHAETPQDADEPHVEFATSDGAALTWDDIRERAARTDAKCVFFAAADRHYVDLYARWYVKSILKHCDVPCLVIVHVIGGAGQLDAIAASAGIRDERLIFAADSFDAGSVTTACYDSPPKGRIEKPVAHFQTVRFLRLNAVLRELNRPVFVSDIDLLLQRGVADLLERCAGDDVVFNENTVSKHAGSRITANLVLVNPTANAGIFLRYLRSYLERMLAKPEVSRWIDQFALLLARHHLSLKGNAPRIGYFDTEKDINNVMFPSFQENPFRFLSLYHGFDLTSLDDTQTEEKSSSGTSLAA